MASSSCAPGGAGDRAARTTCSATTPSPCGTRAAASCSAPGTTSARGPSTTHGRGSASSSPARYRRRGKCFEPKFSRRLGTRRTQLRLLRGGGVSERMEGWAASGAARGIEYRYPLLDRRVLEFALGLPHEQLRHGKLGRWLMRRAFDPVLPPEVCWNPSKADPARVEAMEDAFAEALPMVRRELRRPRRPAIPGPIHRHAALAGTPGHGPVSGGPEVFTCSERPAAPGFPEVSGSSGRPRRRAGLIPKPAQPFRGPEIRHEPVDPSGDLMKNASSCPIFQDAHRNEPGARRCHMSPPPPPPPPPPAGH